MKKTTLLLLSGTAFLLLGKQSIAQIEKGSMSFNIGAGYSLFSTPSNANNTGTGSQGSSLPVICGMFDYALVNNFTYGIGISYQYFTEPNNVYTQPPTITSYENIYVTNISIRALYHFGSSDLEGYTGIRLGYSMWTQTGYSGNPDNSGYPKNVPTFMALVGVRAKISNLIGIHLEVGIGSPYAAETGISFTIGRGIPAGIPPLPPAVQPVK
ncbi:MAG TPA: hypothetical protein VN922_14635 [Bacteroidia bacterium]|nr:hypothetical protein [Bacteroidia bacterium]